MHLLLMVVLPALVAGQCQVNLDSVSGKYPPLLLQDKAFVYPTSQNEGEDRLLSFEEGEGLQLFCHGSKRYQPVTYLKRNDTTVMESSVGLTCLGGTFKVSGTSEEIEVAKTTCNRKQEPRLVRKKEQCSAVGSDGRTENLGSLVRVSIGWQLGETFLEQIGLCVDEKNYGTLWTNHTLHGASVPFRDIEPGRPSFRIDTSRNKRFFTWTTSTKMTKLYSKKTSDSTVTAILGGKTKLEGEEIIETSSSGTDYFAKGHLSPDAAFIYNVEQDATYYFVNVAPQFQSFNNGNWKALEGAVRDLGAQLGRDLVVTTGTHEILEYPDTNRKMKAIHLARIEKYVPAPKYYWKIVQDPQTNTAAAFIGLNDPHTNVAPLELCRNRCAEMSHWVDWKLTNLDSGYMYCCSVEDAAKAIQEMPPVSAPGGLLGGQGGTDHTQEGEDACMAGPCNCKCSKNADQDYSCTCTCPGVAPIPANP